MGTAPAAGLNVAMASDQRLAWVVVTVSVWIAMGALTRYSDANPFVGSLVRLV